MKPVYWFSGFGNDWLTSLHEVEVAQFSGVSILPTSPGPLLVLVLVLGAGIFHLWNRYRHWQKLAFRREGLQLLAELDQLFIAGDLTSLRQLNKIIKRCALQISGRLNTANLTGLAWGEYIVSVQAGETDLANRLMPDDMQIIESWAYDASVESIDIQQARRIIDKVKYWIYALNEPRAKPRSRL